MQRSSSWKATCLRAQVGETYDWRLSVANMERRDGYFTRLKARCELLKKINNEKARCRIRRAAPRPAHR